VIDGSASGCGVAGIWPLLYRVRASAPHPAAHVAREMYLICAPLVAFGLWLWPC
jgi:hypothetical protein